MNRCQYVITDLDQLETALQDMIDALNKHHSLNVEWKKKGNDRSLNQNNLFHVWAGEIASQMYQRTGDESYTKQTIKLYLKKRFLGTEDIAFGRTVIKDQIKRSSKLDTGEMFFFMQQIETFAFENNLELSHPAGNEYDKLTEAQHET